MAKKEDYYSFKLALGSKKGYQVQVYRWDSNQHKWFLKQESNTTLTSVMKLPEEHAVNLMAGRAIVVKEEQTKLIYRLLNIGRFDALKGPCKTCKGKKFIPLLGFYSGCPDCNDIKGRFTKDDIERIYHGA